MLNNMDEKKRLLFEKAPITNAIFSLAIPSIISQLILVIYNMVDTFFIGQASRMIDESLASELIAGVTISMPIYMILTAISNLFGIGAASVISRSLGKGNLWRAKNSSRFAFWGCLFTTLAYSLLILLINKPVAYFISGGAPLTAKFAEEYILFCVCIFGVPTAINTLFSHLIRSQGKSTHASIGIALGGILNCILDPIFIFVIFDIEDAAIAAALATGVANVVALIYYLVLFFLKRKTLVISLKLSSKALSENIPKEVLRIGTPACLMTLCENISYIILDNLVGTVLTLNALTEETLSLSASALAGVGVAKKINMVAHSIVRGMSQGVLPLIGYNKSSGNRRRMTKIVYVSGLISFSIALLCTLLSFTFARPFSNIFVHEEQSILYASLFLKILSIGAPLSALAYTVISFFQAVGKAWRSLILALLRKGILDIPLMYIFHYIASQNENSFGPGLILWATPISDFVCAIISLTLLFVYIKWHGQDKIKDKETIDNNQLLQ